MKKYIAPILAILLIGAGVFVFIKKHTTISSESVAMLQELNEKYDMVLTENLMTGTSIPPLFADIIAIEHSSTLNRGLILSTQDSILLVQPLKEFSYTKLQEIAGEYSKKTSGIHFEVDQDINMATEIDIATSEAEITTINQAEGENEIHIAIIDSGLQTDHPTFEETEIETTLSSNTINGDSDVSDDISHGTHIAGIIANNTQNATLMPYKVINQNEGKLSNVIKAISLAVEENADIVNMSFGVLEDSYALKQVIETSYEENGTIFVAAAGNFDTTDYFYPASYDKAIAVGSVYSNGLKMRNSNYGDWVDLAARGYHINSSIPYDEYAYMSGTSQATAYVTSEIANLFQQEGRKLSIDEILEIFHETMSPTTDEELNGIPFVNGL